ncbi:MAG: ATP-binding protein [Planctomycetota bacterium]
MSTYNADVLNWEIRSDPCELPAVRERFAAWAIGHGWSKEQSAEIALAVDEALSNVIRHSYDCETTHTIQIALETIESSDHGPGLEIRLRDFGQQVDPANIKGRALDDVRPGGLGVHIIRAMMNSAEYSRASGGGMLLVMRKYKNHTVDSRRPQAN